MKVYELIEALKDMPQDLEIVIPKYSENCTFDKEDLELVELCEARPDGWVHDKRPDKTVYEYLRIRV